MTFTERGTIGDYFWLFQTHSCEIAFGCWCMSLMLYIASFSCRFLWTLSFGVLWMFFSNQLCKLPLIVWKNVLSTLLLLSHVSRVWLCTTPEMAAHQSPPSLGFSRQEHWRGLPFPSPMHESEKWKWSRSVVSDSFQPHGVQPTRLLCPWDCPGKSTGVGLSTLKHLCKIMKAKS